MSEQFNTGNESPAPGVDQTATKAVIAGVGGFALAFLSALLTVWTDTDPLTARDLAVGAVAGLGTGLGLGTAVYKIPNEPK